MRWLWAQMIADILLRFRKIFGGPPQGDPSVVMNQKMEDMRQGRYQDDDYQLKSRQGEVLAANEGVEGILRKLASHESVSKLWYIIGRRVEIESLL